MELRKDGLKCNIDLWLMIQPFVSNLLCRKWWQLIQGGIIRYRNTFCSRQNGCCTIWGVRSFARFWRWGFWEFPRLVGRYCSYLLHMQAGRTTQIIVLKKPCEWSDAPRCIWFIVQSIVTVWFYKIHDSFNDKCTKQSQNRLLQCNFSLTGAPRRAARSRGPWRRPRTWPHQSHLRFPLFRDLHCINHTFVSDYLIGRRFCTAL